ncbi:unnamed protein product [Prorocentrum cordatum]|uniref:Uncharacterized protein n=1 Tax=Prorocentrum cordatum TaxID=2364126 RepID=A0ABN9WU83_9DINO|nr:unnamed protein product [Polarella glacialis]
MTKAAAGLKLSNSPGTAVQNTLRALQCRDADKLYQREELERRAGIDREHVYQSRKIANKLDLNKVISDISKPCWKRDSEHTCLDAFRHHPEAVPRWRQMWHSLPKHDRAQRLAAEYAQAFEAHTARRMGDSTCFQMQYRIFGRKVCRDAFIALTGMHACTLQDARNLAAKDQCVKDLLLRKLGQHYEFQAAQRMAMNQLFAESERHPEELVTVGWDKMDQAKTILPRVKALSNTQFQKGGSRLIAHLIGVLSPTLWDNPVFYTVFENQVQGGQPLEEKINLVRKNAKRGMGQASQLVKGVDTDALDKAIAAAFPGSSAGGWLSINAMS